jgi:16S rRNA C967 or C1407 C5-methylase (RsmB/RsmF family)/NOL1/NOP2/fmu family ribosome biogenesis protein
LKEYNLPKELISSLEGLPGFDRAAFEAVHAGGGQVTSIRVNPGKQAASGGALAGGGMLAGGAEMERVPWSSFGYYLSQRPSFTFDPLLHAGAYYVQEASSMFLEQAIRQTVDLSRPLRVLDLCAAPGGKSTLLQSLLTADSLLVSNEVIRNRANILEENLVKWGGVNTVVTSSEAGGMGRLEGTYDCIVVDAPCSGSGLFRREPEAVEEWSPDNVKLCYQRQRRILADVWPALKRGGVLIYSTCSYSREENEDVLDWMLEELGASGYRLNVAAEWNIVETRGERGAYGYRFYPDKIRGEGLYMACVRKEDGEEFVASRKKGGVERLVKKDEMAVRGWIRPEEELAYFRHGEVIHAIPAVLMADLSVLRTGCYLRRAGIPLGKLSAAAFIPEHDLAVSMIVSPQLPALSVSKDQALQYLRKDELAAEGSPPGWTLVQYGGLNLGWIKVLPGRINNYYPKEWRIRRREP